MNQSKGFTLIELMIVVMIIGILAAVAIPQFQRFHAQKLIKEGVPIEKVESETIRKYMIQIMEKKVQARKRAENAKQEFQSLVPESRKSKPAVTTNNPHKAEVKTVIEKVEPLPFVITCKDRELLVARCTLNMNSGNNRYLLPINCERTDNINEWKCEIF